MSRSDNRYAYEGEPELMMYVREYILPAVLFTALTYYLVFSVLLPMRRIARPTRRTAGEITEAAATAATAAGGTGSTSNPAPTAAVALEDKSTSKTKDS